MKDTNVQNNKAVAYMRFSSYNQDENSIEYQRGAIHAYCKQHGYSIVKEYVDEAYTATNDRRPAFQQMVQDAQNKPEWASVMVFDLNRFARNNKDANNYTALLEDHDICLISVTQDFGDTIEGFLIRGILNLINEYFSRVNSKHTHAGLKNKAEKGIHCGGVPPLGYDVSSDKKLVINANEAEIVKKIFTMFEQNYSYAQIADTLNSEGYKTKTGKPFNKNSFSSILHQEKYTGLYTWNKIRQKNSQGVRNSHAFKPIEKQVRIDDACPVIIPAEQFERVQNMIASRQNGVAASKSKNHYMLGRLNFLKCAECGANMIGAVRQSHGNRYIVYYCPNHKKKECPTKEIQGAPLEKMVAKLLAKDLFQRDDLKTISQELKKNDEYKAIEAKLHGNEKAKRNVLKAVCASYDESLTKKLQTLSTEKVALQRKLALAEVQISGIDEENKKEVCKEFARYLMKSRDSEVKTYLAKMIHEITVSNDSVSITLNEF